ncbi:AraC family transcriptional regulator [Wukongibacter baidiensis]|uniref:helix-turn-helix domain-containing protein n=1 Tax=Wukongibacter baidiensis TaxID=1723361 RepID=UPI003D7F2DC8
MDNITSGYNNNFPMKLTIQKVINYPFHYKDELRIILVLKGSINLTAVSGSIILKENDIDTISINEPASISMVDEDNIVAILSIDSKFAEKYFPNIKNITFNCNFDHFYPSTAESTEIDILRKHVIKLICTFYEDETDYKRIESLLENLLRIMMTHFDDVKNIFENTSNMSMHFDRFRRIIDYILNNLESKITLQDIAKNEYLDFHYLSNEFNSRLSNNFYDTLNYYRILHSVRLLLGTDLSIRDISINSGFSATRYFYKYFKKYLECTPAEFRKNNKKVSSIYNDSYKELDKSSQLMVLEPYFDKLNYLKSSKKNLRYLKIDLLNSSKVAHSQSIQRNIRYSNENPTSTNNNYFFDTTYLSSYIVNDAILNTNTPGFIRPVDSLGDENSIFDSVSTFSGSCSLITRDGLKKPSYYAYYLLSLLGDDLLEKGEDFIITKKDEDLCILLCNFINIDIWDVNDNTFYEELYKKTIANKENLKKFNIDIQSLKNCYRLVRYRLDYQHGSVFYNWLSIGKPRHITEYYKTLFNKAAFPKLTFGFVNEENINLSSELLPWGVELIVLEKID